MTKKAEELDRLNCNPRGIRFSDLERIILRAGFALDRTRGSHHVYGRGNRVLKGREAPREAEDLSPARRN